MSTPKRASEVPLDPNVMGKTEQQVKQERVTKAVRGRQARKEALRRTGALDGSGSPDLATKLEARKNAIDRKVMQGSKAKEAVAARLAAKRA